MTKMPSLDISTKDKMQLSIKQACAILGISRTTLYRRLTAGTLQCTRSAEQQKGFEQIVHFSPEQLGLNESQVLARLSAHDVTVNENYEDPRDKVSLRPESAPSDKLSERPAPRGDFAASDITIPSAAFQPRELTVLEQKALSDIEFAQEFQAGNAVDSCGNSVTGNRSWPSHGKISLLGPSGPSEPKPKLLGNEHMTSPTGDATAPPHPVTSDETTERWHPGAAARKREQYQAAGQRQPSQQEAKKTLDAAAIRAAFRHGYSR